MRGMAARGGGGGARYKSTGTFNWELGIELVVPTTTIHLSNNKNGWGRALGSDWQGIRGTPTMSPTNHWGLVMGVIRGTWGTGANNGGISLQWGTTTTTAVNAQPSNGRKGVRVGMEWG